MGQAMNKQEAIKSAMAQMEAITNGNHVNKPVSVVMCGESAEAPAFLAYELEQIIGKPVVIEWRQEKRKAVLGQRNNTGEVTDGYAKYYEDAARRGARTGD